MLEMTLCRLCGALGPDMLSFDSDEQLRRQITEYIPIKLVQIIGLPNTICVRCRGYLTRHAEFVENCTMSMHDLDQRAAGCRVSKVVPANRTPNDKKAVDDGCANDVSVLIKTHELEGEADCRVGEATPVTIRPTGSTNQISFDKEMDEIVENNPSLVIMMHELEQLAACCHVHESAPVSASPTGSIGQISGGREVTDDCENDVSVVEKTNIEVQNLCRGGGEEELDQLEGQREEEKPVEICN